MYLLTIFIPTYKRTKSLLRQLDAIQSLNIKKFKISVIVSDNATPLKNNIPSKYPNFIFYQNAVNIGGNANHARGFSSANNSEYLWLLSDNDFVNGNKIEELLVELSQSTVDFVIFDLDTTKLRVESVYQNDLRYIWKKGLISNCIYKADNLKNYGVVPYFYHNTSFPHLAMALKILTTKKVINYLILPRKHFFEESKLSQDLTRESKSVDGYGLSQNGMPLLIELMPENFGREFALSWFVNNGYRTINIKPDYLGTSLKTVRTKSYSILKNKLGLLFYPIWLFSVFKYIAWLIYRFLKK